MEKDKIRYEIAADLKGKPSRNPDSLISELSKLLGVTAEEVSNQVNNMRDLGHIVRTERASIRLSEKAERIYFSTNKEKIFVFLKQNWAHVTSHLLALVALLVAFYK